MSEKEKRKSRPVSRFRTMNVSPHRWRSSALLVYMLRVNVYECDWSSSLNFKTATEQRETDCVRVRVQLTIHGETSFYSFLFAKRPFTLWRQRITPHRTFLFFFFPCPRMFVYGSVSGHISSRMTTTPSSKFGPPWRLFTPCPTAEGRLKIT